MLHRFKNIITRASEAEIRRDPTLAGDLVIERQADIVVSYAPFEYVQASARVVLVGITPGALQASNALSSARRDLLAGLPDHEVFARAKVHASFSGAMRGNLIAMLDSIGVARWLGVPSTSGLWDQDAGLAHFTSAICYPTFVRGTNYSGMPAISSVQMLRGIVMDCLAAEAKALPDAVWVPLGPVAAAALRLLTTGGILTASRVLEGLPHPSGANAERIAYFLGRKERALLSPKTNPDTLDAARTDLVAKVGDL